jgi:hypothetical protein
MIMFSPHFTRLPTTIRTAWFIQDTQHAAILLMSVFLYPVRLHTCREVSEAVTEKWLEMTGKTERSVQENDFNVQVEFYPTLFLR